ncbi:hypothetical protein EDB85DRAFT_1896669 [Lactarius pseudohatsudake]|nr:hypothetical protein EDB85DRAFT_1896669 [Lactarius pseudohatsudake]
MTTGWGREVQRINAQGSQGSEGSALYGVTSVRGEAAAVYDAFRVKVKCIVRERGVERDGGNGTSVRKRIEKWHRHKQTKGYGRDHEESTLQDLRKPPPNSSDGTMARMASNGVLQATRSNRVDQRETMGDGREASEGMKGGLGQGVRGMSFGGIPQVSGVRQGGDNYERRWK